MGEPPDHRDGLSTPGATGARQSPITGAMDAAGGNDLCGRLLAFALAFPEAWEDHPWGESVVKVGKKVFVFSGVGENAGISVKLPESAEQALLLECAAPTGYGLGRSGWVSIWFTKPGVPPAEVLEDWIEESYRAVATKKLIKQLDALRA